VGGVGKQGGSLILLAQAIQQVGRTAVSKHLRRHWAKPRFAWTYVDCW
jgi:hypothetical protein